MSFPRYPEYKDSGVEWLGEVPAHWDVTPLKHVAEFASGGTPDKRRIDYWDGDVPWASAKDMKLDLLLDTADHITAAALTDRAASLVPAGTVLVVVRGMILARVFPVVTTGVPMAINQDLKAVCARAPGRNDWLAWLLRASEPETLNRLDEAGHGTKALRMDAWADMRIPVPAAQDQDVIAAFLDRETAKIDALVEEQQRLIELLKEKRQAMISQAVTKGLDPNVPMKDSGVEWLGKVPAHWEVLRVKALSSFLTSGPRGWSDRISEEGAIFIQSGDLTESLGINFAGAKRVSVSDDAETARTQLCVDDVLVCITGAKTGKVAVCERLDEPAFINQHICLIRPKAGQVSAFLGAYLHSEGGQRYFELAQYGLKQGLSLENVADAVVPIPPKDEQIRIASFVSEIAIRVAMLIGAAESSISYLQERRAALISAAVTGKIDVRGLAA